MSSRSELIQQRLAALSPVELTVTDESHKHVGHAGAQDGRGHFHVHIVAAAFAGKPPLGRHRMVYAALGDLMETDIHALGIEALTPEETKSQELK
ncbi:MAG: BolA family transcriptional regulator [Gammaproteobacteria bacterium]|nr:BolA family transcriptional regulator [Gammaproteobacteria bacterium]